MIFKLNAPRILLLVRLLMVLCAKMLLIRSCSPTTVNIEFRTLRACFNYAIKWHIIYDNPFKSSKTLRVPESRPIYFTREEFIQMISMVRNDTLRDIFCFAVLTGMRQGEILHLRWLDIDFDRRTIMVVNNERFLTKTGICRDIPMNDYVYKMLVERKKTSQGEYVFGSLSESYVGHRFKSYVRGAGLSEELHFHSLRHTFATWLVQDGASLYEIQKLLGHSDLKTTQVYAHLIPSLMHSTVNRLVL